MEKVEYFAILQTSKIVYNYIYQDIDEFNNRYNTKDNFKNLVSEFIKNSNKKLKLEDIYIFLKFYTIQSYNYICNSFDFEYMNKNIKDFILKSSDDFVFVRLNPKFSELDIKNLIYYIKCLDRYINTLSIFNSNVKRLKKILNHILGFYWFEFLKRIKRELKYIDIITHLIGLIEDFDYKKAT